MKQNALQVVHYPEPFILLIRYKINGSFFSDISSRILSSVVLSDNLIFKWDSHLIFFLNCRLENVSAWYHLIVCTNRKLSIFWNSVKIMCMLPSRSWLMIKNSIFNWNHNSNLKNDFYMIITLYMSVYGYKVNHTNDITNLP